MKIKIQNKTAFTGGVITSIGGKTYFCPGWVEVPEGTVIEDIEFEETPYKRKAPRVSKTSSGIIKRDEYGLFIKSGSVLARPIYPSLFNLKDEVSFYSLHENEKVVVSKGKIREIWLLK